MRLAALKAEIDHLGPHANRLGQELLVAAAEGLSTTVIVLAAAVLDVALREPSGPAGTADGMSMAEARDGREAFWLRERRNGIVHYEGGRGGLMGADDDNVILAKDARRALDALTEALVTLRY
ncbi:MAG: hypothetical protein O2938_07015 [Proteobacteria bacterium]|jgi:hypothetical protein|nr:hypothetical protein [Pseudomonadota bacterium]